MSLEYYLFCRDKYQEIILNLEDTVNTYDSIINSTITDENIKYNCCEIFQHESNIIFFIDKLNLIKQFKKLCDDKINNLCIHEFEDDLIDISPDKSINIKYCKICGYTK